MTARQEAAALFRTSGDVRLACVVARDGIEQHYELLSVPLTGIYLDPRLEAARRLSA